MSSTSRFASSGTSEQDAATRKALEVAAMLSKTLNNVAPPSAASSKNTMMIPSTKVGMVIGKAGSRIREIENEAGVRLQLDSMGEPFRKLWIMGEDENVAIAKDKIQRILDTKFAGRGSQDPTKIIPIPCERVGLIIGAGGITIKRFSQEHNVHLKVVSEEEALRTHQKIPEKGTQHLHIVGTAEAAENCEKAVLEFLNRDGAKPRGGAYGAYQPPIWQQRVQPYPTYLPQGYGAMVQSYANVAHPYVNTNYAYAQPGHVYPPQVYAAQAQALPGFQQYLPFPQQFVPPSDSSKSGQTEYPTAEDVQKKTTLYQPTQAGYQSINDQSPLNFGSQIQNMQTPSADTRPVNPNLPLVENQFQEKQQEKNGNSKVPSQSDGQQPGIAGMQQVNNQSAPLLNYPVQNYPAVAENHVPSQRQPSKEQVDYNPGYSGGNLPIHPLTSSAQVIPPRGLPSNIISPVNPQQLPVPEVKPSMNFQTSTIVSNNSGRQQGPNQTKQSSVTRQ
jgi:rRNA processing protein Krr1/Pno1